MAFGSCERSDRIHAANTTRKRIVANIFLLAAVLALSSGTATAQDRDRKEEVRRKFSHSGVVMPPDAIVVLDPGVDAKGDPRPMLRDAPDGGLLVEIPPTVHVHRYFPTGPRDFQAQYFAGGPTIVSARHPFSGERVHVHLDLAPGFPRVEYTSDEIHYKYAEETFSVHFHKHGDVSTSYSRCSVAKVRMKKAAEQTKERTGDLTERLRLNELGTKAYRETRDIGSGATDRAGQMIAHSSNMFFTALNLVPGYQLVKSRAGDQATRQRDRAVQRVTRERARAESDIPTLR